METISLLGMLFFMGYEDIKTHKVRDILLLIFGLIGMMFHISNGRISFVSLLGGFLIGCFLFLISLITHEKIGKGDAFVIMLTGIFLGFWQNILLSWLAFSLAGIVSFAAIILKKKNVNDELAFIPFVFLGYLFLLIINGGKI